MFDFDTVIDRKHTMSLKYDFADAKGRPRDAIPFWIADMDFKTAPCVTDALRRRLDHGIMGYSDMTDDYFRAVHQWFLTHFGWDVKKEWLIKTPGIVPALNMAVRALTKPDDAILIQPPVYHWFEAVIRNNGRRLVKSPLIRRGKKYSMNDLDDIERKIVENNVSLSILCSPQNPTGRVWTREELAQYSAICRRHNVHIIVDEIHCDFTYPGYAHTAFGTLGEEDAMNAVICTAPTKTFNIAGLQDSNIWIPNPALREAFPEAKDWRDFYAEDAVALHMKEAHYDIQYLCYLAAAKRLLRARLGEGAEERLGGALYFFVRGASAGRGVAVLPYEDVAERVKILEEMLGD